MYSVYIDLDGTLLDDEKKISDFTFRVIKEFISQGNEVVLTTARSGQLGGLQAKVRDLTPYFIFHNGGEVAVNGEIIYRDYFSIEDARRIGLYLTNNMIKAAVILDNAYYANYDAKAVWGNINNFHYTRFGDISFSIPKYSVLLDERKQIDTLNALKDCAKVTYIDQSSSAIVSPIMASKGRAARYLQDNLFCGNKSIFIGNDYNDVSGFEACETSVAVANAEEGLLKKADVIIDSNNNEGVAHYIKSLMK